MYATARNSIPPLGFEEKAQSDYRSDGSSTFLRRRASSSLKFQWCLTLCISFINSLSSLLTMGTKALDEFNKRACTKLITVFE